MPQQPGLLGARPDAQRRRRNRLGSVALLAAGQTHKEKCTYQGTVNRAILWLVKHQLPDGDLSLRQQETMYSHGLATIALCEAYGMTKDEAPAGPRRRP